jgi:hypothetical protein
MEVLFFQIASLSYTIKRKQYEIYNHSAVFGQTIPLSLPFFSMDVWVTHPGTNLIQKIFF